jgi:hypothetical protein
MPTEFKEKLEITSTYSMNSLPFFFLEILMRVICLRNIKQFAHGSKFYATGSIIILSIIVESQLCGKHYEEIKDKARTYHVAYHTQVGRVT